MAEDLLNHRGLGDQRNIRRRRPTQQIPGLTYQLVYGIGSSDLSLGRTCWSETFNKIVVAA